jgi:threonine synthase
LTWCQECYSQKQYCESCSKINSQKLVRPEKLIKIPDPDYETFNAIVVSREDFEFKEEYKNATQDQKDRIWEIAKKKLGDMLMQDDQYSECLEACINRGLEN